MTEGLVETATAEVGCGPLSARYTEALTYAATLHRNQPRKGTQVPYLAHLLAVSSLVLEDGGSEDEAIAGLLHDAPEDQGREILLYIRRVFGAKVEGIVEGCSDDLPEAGAEKRPWALRKSGYLMHLRGADDSVLRVSAADKAHNAKATVIDIPRTGWPPSNVCLHSNLWWYDALERVISERLPGSRCAESLSRSVDQMFALTPEVTRSEVSGGWPPNCGCGEEPASSKPSKARKATSKAKPRRVVDIPAVGPATDEDEINAEWDPEAIAEAEWEGRQ